MRNSENSNAGKYNDCVFRHLMFIEKNTIGNNIVPLGTKYMFFLNIVDPKLYISTRQDFFLTRSCARKPSKNPHAEAWGWSITCRFFTRNCLKTPNKNTQKVL